MKEPIQATHRPPVWLVLFELLPELRLPFGDRLESRSVVFEQYLIQDLREAATLDDYLGGAAFVSGWGARLERADGGVVWLQVEQGGAESAPAGILTAPELIRVLQPEVFSLQADGLGVSDVRLTAALAGAQLVLVTVGSVRGASGELAEGGLVDSAADVGTAFGRVLSQLEGLAEGFSESRGLPVWLITGYRGVPRSMEGPFESVANESEMHVPLWWTDAASAGTRLQTLCGSFDLLPTLSDFLGLGGGVAEDSEPATSRTCPLSLLSPQLQRAEGAERLLGIEHDAWRGLRTSQYFLVQLRELSGDHELDARETAGQRLYLKPEDYWNVNDCIVSYGEIAREMSAGE